MTIQLLALTFDANDPLRLGRFWAAFLGWELTEDPSDGIVLHPNDDTGFQLRFQPSREPKVGPNQMHFDMPSASWTFDHAPSPTMRAQSRAEPGTPTSRTILSSAALSSTGLPVTGLPVTGPSVAGLPVTGLSVIAVSGTGLSVTGRGCPRLRRPCRRYLRARGRGAA